MSTLATRALLSCLSSGIDSSRTAQQRQDLLDQPIGARVELLVTQVGDWVRYVEKAVAGHAPARRHRFARGAEWLGHDRDGRHTRPLEEDRVEHTARRARPSVADSGDDEVALSPERLERRLVDLVARRALAHHPGHGHPVTAAEAIGESAEQHVGIELRVVDEPDAESVEPD